MQWLFSLLKFSTLCNSLLLTFITGFCSEIPCSNISHFLETSYLNFITIQLTGCHVMRDVGVGILETDYKYFYMSLYMCIYMCIYMCLYACSCKCGYMLYVCVYVYVCLCMYMYIYIYIRIYIYINIYIFICVYVYVCMYIYVHM